jgi:acyl carrier protein
MNYTRSEILDKLKETLAVATGSSSPAIDACTEDSNLVTDLGLNSVGILYVVIAIEDFFSIQFDDVGFNDFKVMGDVIDYIEKKVSAK